MIVFTRKVKVAGVYTNADSLPKITITRLDTNAVVVNNKDMVLGTTGIYTYTLDGSDVDHPLPVDGVTYRAAYTVVVNGATYTSSSDQTASSTSSVAWDLADYAAVEAMIGTANLQILLDLDDDGTVDSADLARMQTAGDTSDAAIYAMARNRRVAVPFTVSSVDMTTLADDAPSRLWWRNVSARWVVRELFRHRLIQDQAQWTDPRNPVLRIVKSIVGDPEEDVRNAADLNGIDSGIDYAEGAEPMPLSATFESVPINSDADAVLDEFGNPLW